MGFKEGFLWGAGASSYQTEGAVYEEGKGISVWDEFCRREGAIRDGHTGEVACDFYHRYKDDIKLMKEVGLKAYRFSISWPRIMPDGFNVNSKGLDFYDRVVDELVKNDIEPIPTMFHWEMPLNLFYKGGWLNRESSDWFAEYTKAVVERISDRAKVWLTINETQSYLGLGHMTTDFAPGLKLSIRDFLTASHHSLMAHGKAAKVIKQFGKSDIKVGSAPVGLVGIPASDSEADISAAKEHTFSVNKKNWENNTWWMDPLYLGKYPDDGVELFEEDMPEIKEGDMEIIAEPLDFCSINVYSGVKVRAGENGKPEVMKNLPGNPKSAFDWDVMPEALYWGPKFFHERYNLPIFVTENGMANIDWVALDGKVHDPQRIDFTKRHLINLEKSVDEGVPVIGYLHWTFLDNFEWIEGYNKRFGMVHVDFNTLKRTPKDSAYWYGEVIKTNGECL